jgi:hypothetical protein
MKIIIATCRPVSRKQLGTKHVSMQVGSWRPTQEQNTFPCKRTFNRRFCVNEHSTNTPVDTATQYKRPSDKKEVKLGGGQSYDRSRDQTAVVAEVTNDRA